MAATYGDAYHAVRHIYDHSPGRSWQRLNWALADTLKAAVGAHLSFKEGDFQAIYSTMAGGYWMGNSIGSVCGEHFYSCAVEHGHTPACMSFEFYAGRPPALWAWDVKTPARLCIGSKFQWQGKEVTVTNIKAEHLVACSYRQNLDWKNPRVGDFEHFSGGTREIKQLRKSGKELIVRFGPVVKDHREDRKPEKIFSIRYEELAEQRRGYDIRKRNAVAQIDAIKTAQGLGVVISQLRNIGKSDIYRPCDIQEIKATIAAKEEAIKKAVA